MNSFATRQVSEASIVPAELNVTGHAELVYISANLIFSIPRQTIITTKQCLTWLPLQTNISLSIQLRDNFHSIRTKRTHECTNAWVFFYYFFILVDRMSLHSLFLSFIFRVFFLFWLELEDMKIENSVFAQGKSGVFPWWECELPCECNERFHPFISTRIIWYFILICCVFCIPIHVCAWLNNIRITDVGVTLHLWILQTNYHHRRFVLSLMFL